MPGEDYTDVGFWFSLGNLEDATDKDWQLQCPLEYQDVLTFLGFPEQKERSVRNETCSVCRKQLGKRFVCTNGKFRFLSRYYHEVSEHGVKPPPELIKAALERVAHGDARPSITCPKCQFESFNPIDVQERYCGNCHEFMDEM